MAIQKLLTKIKLDGGTSTSTSKPTTTTTTSNPKTTTTTKTTTTKTTSTPTAVAIDTTPVSAGKTNLPTLPATTATVNTSTKTSTASTPKAVAIDVTPSAGSKPNLPSLPATTGTTPEEAIVKQQAAVEDVPATEKTKTPIYLPIVDSTPKAEETAPANVQTMSFTTAQPVTGFTPSTPMKLPPIYVADTPSAPSNAYTDISNMSNVVATPASTAPVYEAPVYEAPVAEAPTYEQAQYEYNAQQVDPYADFDTTYLDGVLSGLYSQLDSLKSGKTSYTDQMVEAMNAYQNRDKFSYNPDADPLFQQALSSAMRSGKTAMSNTMGQAAALTGGYGSSYATSAAAQAYNSFVDGVYDNIADYYQMALNEYNMEGSRLLDTYNMYAQMDANEWNRAYDSFGAGLNAYNTDYGNKLAGYNANKDNYYTGKDLQAQYDALDYDKFVDARNFDYQQYRDALDQYNYNNEMAYNQYADNRDFGYQQYRDALNQYNYENEFAYQQAQDALAQSNWERTFNYQQAQDALAQSNWDKTFNYQQTQDALAQSNLDRNFNYNAGQDQLAQDNWQKTFDYQQTQDSLDNEYRWASLNADIAANDAAQNLNAEKFQYQKDSDAYNATYSGGGSAFTDSQIATIRKDALEAFNKTGSFSAVIDKYPALTDDDLRGIDDYVNTYGTRPANKQTYTAYYDAGVSKQYPSTGNATNDFKSGVYVIDGSGNKMSLAEAKNAYMNAATASGMGSVAAEYEWNALEKQLMQSAIGKSLK